jgi:curved DNA-binding protein
MTPDPYAVLGLTPTATADDVKHAYRRLMRELHPDVASDPRATARAAEPNEAYAVLADQARRAQLDSRLRAARRRRRTPSSGSRLRRLSTRPPRLRR